MSRAHIVSRVHIIIDSHLKQRLKLMAAKRDETLTRLIILAVTRLVEEYESDGDAKSGLGGSMEAGAGAFTEHDA